MTQLSNRPRRRLILKSPPPLPKRRRIASRYRRLAAPEPGKMPRGDVSIIGCANSGNTWLRRMLSRASPPRCGLPRHPMVRAEEVTRADVLVADTPSSTLGCRTDAAVGGA